MFSNTTEETKVNMECFVIIKVIEKMLAKCFNIDAKVFVYNVCCVCKTTLWRGNFEYLICKDLAMIASSSMNSVTFWHCIPLISSKFLSLVVLFRSEIDLYDFLILCDVRSKSFFTLHFYFFKAKGDQSFWPVFLIII